MTNINEILEKLGDSLLKNLYVEDETFLQGMREGNGDDAELNKYRFWEWTQGVGLYGFYKLYIQTGDTKYIDYLTKYYDERIKEGLPSKNVNTCAPMLTMAYIYDIVKDPRYLELIKEWSNWVHNEMTRTPEGGLQHLTSDSENKGELWDDTLMMTVMFQHKAGVILNKPEYIEDSIHQFMLHTKYLVDTKTGLWYHGWTFEGRHNFAKALWGRGNSWITIVIPEFVEALADNEGVKTSLKHTLADQVAALAKYQDAGGLWHTLIDDDTSYLETSATAGFAYGILKGVRLGILDEKYLQVGLKAIKALEENILPDGTLDNVSYGTPMGRETKNFYKEIPLSPMPYGQSMAMLAFIEYFIYTENNK